ncbi:hypothetical protein PROFUN_05952 [Planoprotostelium fungivorum]|uniref:Rhodanese domain-containing protein n=1 Tax=Planoprotostelium fungivorum TaxID=1890364 RepID=A0A2P6N7P5_9EUKA|nr:hypothetical protein PROFUN_05952 [Planoprotostelium fungivorum]
MSHLSLRLTGGQKKQLFSHGSLRNNRSQTDPVARRSQSSNQILPRQRKEFLRCSTHKRGTKLLVAALTGDIATLDKLLEKAFKKEEQGKKKLTIFSLINAKDDDTGDSALHLACDAVNYECIDILLRWSGNPNFQNRGKKTALHVAVGRKNLRMVSSLLKAGADSTILDEHSRSPLWHVLAFQSDEMLFEMLKYPINLESPACAPQTPLMESIVLDYLLGARKLLEKGAKVETLNLKSGDTALHLAARKGDASFVEMILERGAKTDVENCEGETAAQSALKAGFEEIYNLISAITNLHSAGDHTDTASSWARSFDLRGSTPRVEEPEEVSQFSVSPMASDDEDDLQFSLEEKRTEQILKDPTRNMKEYFEYCSKLIG